MSVSESRDRESVWAVPAPVRRELLALLSADPTGCTLMTYDEFLAWATEDTHAEWVDGRVVMTSPASLRHQDLVLWLSTVIGQYISLHGLGSVHIAPFQMKLAHSSREPDLLFVARAHRDRLTETYLDGPADLVVEITSPESVRRDRGDKLYEYGEAAISEYWLIEPDRNQAAFYQLNADGLYHPVTAGNDGVYRSQVLTGLWLRPEWLWQEPLPDPVSVLLAIDRDAYGAYLRERLQQAE